MSSKPIVSIKRMGGQQFSAKMRSIGMPSAVKEYKVGWPVDSVYDNGDTGEVITTAAVAKIHEFGNYGIQVGRGAIIPERAFFRNANEQFRHFFGSYVRLISRMGKQFGAKDVTLVAGRHVEFVRDSILSFSEPPNKPSTIRRKGANNPLVETGQMAEDVDYELSKRQ